jgi:protein-tyrosine phosphatase
LKALEAEVEAAVADGSVSAAREQQIQQAIDLVRADLEQAREKSTPEVQPVPEPDDQEPEEEDWEEEELEEIEKDKGKGKDAGKGKKPGKIKDGEEFDD